MVFGVVVPTVAPVIVPKLRVIVSSFSGMSSGLMVATTFWVRVGVLARKVIEVVERV